MFFLARVLRASSAWALRFLTAPWPAGWTQSGSVLVIKTRHHDLQLLPPPVAHDSCVLVKLRRCVCARTVLVCSMIHSVPKISSGTFVAGRQASYCWALFNNWEGHQRTSQTDIRTSLHHCWANSVVNICGAALKGIANHSRGIPTEMRAARDLHTRVHELGKRVLNSPTFSRMSPTMAVSFAFSRAMKSHTSVLYGTIDPLPGQAKSCSAFPITRSTASAHSSTVTSELLCTTAALRV